jgi:pyruvate,water dikinase
VAAACAQLGDGPLAVRSSAQAEDGGLSFAGQLDSRLDVVGIGDLHNAIDEVAASGGTVRVVEYAQSTSGDAGRIAVFVQRMVHARHAGVAFSRDPVTYQPEVDDSHVPTSTTLAGPRLIRPGARGRGPRWRLG